MFPSRVASWRGIEFKKEKKKTNNSHTHSIPGGKLLKCVSFSRWNEDGDKKTADMWSVGQMLCHNTDSSLFKWQTLGDTQGVSRLLSNLENKKNKKILFLCVLWHFSGATNPTQGIFCKTASAAAAAVCQSVCNSPFLSPKKRVCCAGFDHWREVLSLYSTRQVRFAVPPSVTVIFWTRGYWPLMPATWHMRRKRVREDEDVSGGRERKTPR